MRKEEKDGAGDLGSGNETVRVDGDRQHGGQYDKIRKRNQFLAINASNNTRDNFKPRAKTFGWSGQDFRPSIAALRDATPRRLLSGLYHFGNKFKKKVSSDYNEYLGFMTAVRTRVIVLMQRRACCFADIIMKYVHRFCSSGVSVSFVSHVQQLSCRRRSRQTRGAHGCR